MENYNIENLKNLLNIVFNYKCLQNVVKQSVYFYITITSCETPYIIDYMMLNINLTSIQILYYSEPYIFNITKHLYIWNELIY